MIKQVLAFVLAVSLSGTAGLAEPRQPTGKWIVNFADNECVATRNYGSDSDPIYLALKAPAVGDVLQLGVVRKGAAGIPKQTIGQVSFDSGTPLKVSFLEFGVAKLGQRATLANLPIASLAPMRQTTTVRVDATWAEPAKIGTRLGAGSGGRLQDEFAVTQMGALMKMLDDCAAGLRKVWHVWDQSGQGAALKQGPTGDLSKIFSGGDYPTDALLSEQMGTVGIVLLIDEQGKVADCTTVMTSGVPMLDAQSCTIVRERGKFGPAVGLDGKPAKSAWFNRITWRLQ